ncbi:hypothetical protein Tco_1469117, partial [Tanacetum coccineum]
YLPQSVESSEMIICSINYEILSIGITRTTMRVQPAMSPGHSAKVTEVMVLSGSTFRKRYRSSYESPSSLSSPALPEDESLDADDKGERSDDEGHGSDDKGRGLGDEDHWLDNEGRGLEGEGLGLEEEEAALEGQQCRARESIEEITPSTYEVGQSSRSMLEHQGAYRVFAFRQPTLTTWVDPEDDRFYIDILVYPPVAPVQTPLSPEWSFGSLPISPSSLVVPTPIASLVATPTATISVDIDKDVRELYIRSGVVKDEIFSRRYRFRSLEREQERIAMTFGALWRPVLALEAWSGHIDTRLANTS